MAETISITPELVAKGINDLLNERDYWKDRAQAVIRVTGGSRPNRKKLTAKEVGTIRELKRSGESNRSIADVFDINPATVSRIVRGLYHKEIA